ncbi:MAG: hypothetical protein RL238_129 [Actinomycetota bacterium]
MPGTTADPTLATSGPAPTADAARRRHPGAAAEVLLGGALLGTAGVAAAYAPGSTSPAALGLLRIAIGAFLLLALMPMLGGSRRHVFALVRRPTIWFAAVGTAAYQLLFFTAAERAGVAITTLLITGTIPLVAGVLGWVLLKERPSRRWAFATLIALVGLTLRSWTQLTVDDATGALMAFAAGALVACYWIINKYELTRGEHPAELATAAYLLSSVVLAPFALTHSWAWALTPAGIVVAIYLGVMTMALGNVLTIRGMHGLSPGHSATLLLSDPGVATVLGVVLLDEHLDAAAVVGVALVLGALVTLARPGD